MREYRHYSLHRRLDGPLREYRHYSFHRRLDGPQNQHNEFNEETNQTTHLHFVAKLRMNGAIPTQLSPHGVYRNNVTLLLSPELANKNHEKVIHTYVSSIQMHVKMYHTHRMITIRFAFRKT